MMDDIQIDQQNLQERKRPNNNSNEDAEMVLYYLYKFQLVERYYIHRLHILWAKGCLLSQYKNLD
jgi:hypothetical protein